MFTSHVSRHLAAFIAGQLSEVEARRIEMHLRNCARCQAEAAQIREGMSALRHLPPVEAPDAIGAAVWSAIELALREGQSAPVRQHRLRWAIASAFVLVLIAAGIGYWRISHPRGPRWQVVWLDGSGARQVGAGQWLETDSRSRAKVEVGSIGSVDVAPNTRLRVVTERPDEHRLQLARGEIHATISAPPRLFFVDTAAGTAVDLGCEYTLSDDDLGSGLLRVTRGWVLFQWKGIESMVPAGASCRTKPKLGLGIPYFDDAPETLKQALDAFVFEKAGNKERSAAFETILSQSRKSDTLSLWHLLSRVDPGLRGRVFDRMVSLGPVPKGVTRDQVLKLDPQTLTHWREELAWTW
jgi:hypothetical protein